jgi:hypothetical protein
MRNTNRIAALVVAAGCAAPAIAQLKDAPPPPAGFPKFKVQEIATDLKIGYAVHVCDVNGDGKPDIVVVDKERVVWYENPTWKMRPIITGKTKPDNVCIASLDIDGDGKTDFVLGAGWRPADTKNPGTLQWLSRGKTLDEEWTVHPIPCDEPTVHRVKVADIYGDGKPAIVMAPLQGRDCTAKGNWVDGRPVRILAYRVPKDPVNGKWEPQVLVEDLHTVHNFTFVGGGSEVPKIERQMAFEKSVYSHTRAHLITASREGVCQFERAESYGKRTFNIGGTVTAEKLTFDTNKPVLNRRRVVGATEHAAVSGGMGASEIAFFPFGFGWNPWSDFGDPPHGVFAAVEPWHGNQFVVYTQSTKFVDRYDRTVIDDHLRWGHAVQFVQEKNSIPLFLALGVRDNPDPKQGDTFTEKRGVRIYRNTDGKGVKWDRYILEDGGVAVEDLTVADLNGDGKPDIIAVGRQTGNCRIYWNQGK